MLSPPIRVNRLGWNFGSLYSLTRAIVLGTFLLPVGTSKPEVGFSPWNQLCFGVNFFLESIKTHSETIFSLSDIGGNGNTDKNLFVQEYTVIWGHFRSKRSNRVNLGCKGLKMMKRVEKYKKGMKYSSNISNSFWNSDDIIISSKYISKSYWQFSGNLLYFEEVMTHRNFKNPVFDQNWPFLTLFSTFKRFL